MYILPSKSFLKRRWRGFTLIELLVVISIIFILMMMTVAGLSYFREKAKKAATHALLGKIQLALKNYYEVFLDYPPSSYGHWKGSQNLYYYLAQELYYQTAFDPFTESALTRRFGPAIGPEGFKKKEIDAEKYVIDSWGNRLYYQKPGEDHRPNGKNNTKTYDLESYGPNGTPNKDNDPENDDINNWIIEK